MLVGKDTIPNAVPCEVVCSIPGIEQQLQLAEEGLSISFLAKSSGKVKEKIGKLYNQEGENIKHQTHNSNYPRDPNQIQNSTSR